MKFLNKVTPLVSTKVHVQCTPVYIGVIPSFPLSLSLHGKHSPCLSSHTFLFSPNQFLYFLFRRFSKMKFRPEPCVVILFQLMSIYRVIRTCKRVIIVSWRVHFSHKSNCCITSTTAEELFRWLLFQLWPASKRCWITWQPCCSTPKFCLHFLDPVLIAQ